jgi:hypothetical protein
VRSTDVRIGATVRVDKDYRKHPKLRVLVGSIKQRYGAPSYTALEVRFEDGHTRLFWPEELELVKEASSRYSWRRIFERR